MLNQLSACELHKKTFKKTVKYTVECHFRICWPVPRILLLHKKRTYLQSSAYHSFFLPKNQVNINAAGKRLWCQLIIEQLLRRDSFFDRSQSIVIEVHLLLEFSFHEKYLDNCEYSLFFKYLIFWKHIN